MQSVWFHHLGIRSLTVFSVTLAIGGRKKPSKFEKSTTLNSGNTGLIAEMFGFIAKEGLKTVGFITGLLNANAFVTGTFAVRIGVDKLVWIKKHFSQRL